MVERFLTERQLGDLLGLSRSTLNKLRSQDLPYHLIGDSVRYRQSQVEEWLEAQQKQMGKSDEEE